VRLPPNPIFSFERAALLRNAGISFLNTATFLIRVRQEPHPPGLAGASTRVGGGCVSRNEFADLREMADQRLVERGEQGMVFLRQRYEIKVIPLAVARDPSERHGPGAVQSSRDKLASAPLGDHTHEAQASAGGWSGGRIRSWTRRGRLRIWSEAS